MTRRFNTDADTCRTLMDLLVSHGVKYCVVSPGSRNAPLLVAAAREQRLIKEVVVDERSAGFVALGIASASNKPVALICTSGSAMLNYAPAVAEAYYRHIPLIVITADRPPQWIDQDDSQTIRQPGALTNIVKRTYNLSGRSTNVSQRWWINREINDALIFSQSACKGPVHINIYIDEPIGHLVEVKQSGGERSIAVVAPKAAFTVSEARWFANELLPPRKVLIILGFADPSDQLNRAISKLAKLPNVVVMTESIANVRAKGAIQRIDSTLRLLPNDCLNDYRPDVVITAGGALVSRMIKRFVRECDNHVEHWHIGVFDHTIDCFQHLTRRIEVEPQVFFSQLASAMSSRNGASDFRDLWSRLAQNAAIDHDEFIAKMPWSDLVATRALFEMIPKSWNIHLSNGTAVRYGQLMADNQGARVDCNRGVSGIDGCTSTAIGASIANQSPTLLISGDMSFQYDIAALSLKQLSPRMKFVVLCNGGGAIFRFIDATRELPEVDDYLSVGVNLPLDDLCNGYGIELYKASSLYDLEQQFPLFASQSERPALLAICTDGRLSAEVLKKYFQCK